MKQRLQKSLCFLNRCERLACSAALLLMALLLFADVLLRSLAGSGLAWSQQVAVYANIVVSMLGLGLASAADTHLRPRFADHWLPARWEPLLQHLQPLVSALVFVVFAGLAVQLVVESYQLQERSTVLGIPLWPVQGLIPLAFAIAAFRHGCYACYPALLTATPSAVTTSQG